MNNKKTHRIRLVLACLILAYPAVWADDLPKGKGFETPTGAKLVITTSAPPIICHAPLRTLEFATKDDTGLQIEAMFVKGESAASTEMPKGTCSWQTRPMTPEEPSKLCKTVGYGWVTFENQGDAKYGDTNRWSVEGPAEEMSFLDRIAASDGIIRVFVERDGDCFTVLRTP